MSGARARLPRAVAIAHAAARGDTWVAARAALTHLPPGARGTLETLLALPLLPARDLARLDGGVAAATTAARLAALRAAGLARPVELRAGIASPTRAVALWHPTDLGVAALGAAAGREPVGLARAFGCDRPALLAALAAPLPLLSLYELAGRLAGAGAGCPYLLGWERPWRGVSARAVDGARRRAPVQLPTRLRLRWTGGPGEAARRGDDPVGDWLLLADDPALPPRRWRATLVWLAGQARRAGVRDLPPLLIAARGGGRCAGWRAFLRAIWGEAAAWPVRVLNLDDPGDLPNGGDGLAVPACPPCLRVVPRLAAGAADRPIPRPVGGPLAPDAPALALAGADWTCLAVHADHTFLTRAAAAQLLHLPPDRARARRAALVARGLLRPVPAAELADALRRRSAKQGDAARRAETLAAREPAEVTAAGLAFLCRWWGLTGPGAARWRGIAGGGPERSLGRRGELLTMIEHTLGVDTLMAGLAAAARAVGGELVAWHSAARAGFAWTGPWPDAYGVCRRGGSDWHFWLEYDRARERGDAWVAKLCRYHRLRDRRLAEAGAALRAELPVWPRLLIVTQAEKDEATIARAAATAAHGHGPPLDLLLTTEARVAATPEGLLGAVWRCAGDGDAPRRHWQEAGGPGQPFRGVAGRVAWQPRRIVAGTYSDERDDDLDYEDFDRLMRRSPDRH